MSLTRTLATIAQADDPLVDPAVAAALPTADAGAQARIVAMLLERGRPAGLAGLVSHYHQLADPVRQQVLAAAEGLGAACQAVAGDADRAARINMIEIIEAGSMPRLAYLLAGQLRVDDGQLTRAAATALLRLTRRYLLPTGTNGGASGSAATSTAAGAAEWAVEALRSALVEACAVFERHRRRDVLLAVVCFAPRFGDRLARHAVEREGAAAAALSGLIAQGEHPLVRRQLLPLACAAPLTPAVTEALRRGEAGEDLASVLGHGYLLVVPAVRRAVRAAGGGERLVPGPAAVGEMADASRRWLWRWVEVVGADPEQLASLVGGLATDTRRGVRLAALRWLCRQEAEPLDDVLATLCFDPDPAIARIALRRLIARRWGGLNRLMLRLVASEHEGVRRLVESHIAPIGFERLWANWQHLTAEDQVGAARALLRIDRGFGRKLWQKLRSEAAEDRLRAVMMVRRLGQVSYYEPDLRRLSKDGDERVASAAVKALGEGRADGSSEQAIVEALGHGDDRVRANAVEAIERLDRAGRYTVQLKRIAEASGNRSRATSIKALLSMPLREAMPKLRAMLSDGDERHRASALWVVEKLGLGSVVPEVALMARGDGSGRVRRRALRVLRDLAAQRRAGQQAEAGADAANHPEASGVGAQPEGGRS